MAPRQVPVTLTYRKAGTQPPIFVAGSFSDSAWQPQEMTYETDEHGEYIFKKVVPVEEGLEIQFKFRIGLGDWWATNEETETVSDGNGNFNNFIKVPDLEDTVDEDDLTEELCPMFSHECPETENDADSTDDAQYRKKVNGHGSNVSAQVDEEVDYDDPTLERFPSDSRLSITEALRRIETNTGEDHTVVEANSLSSPLLLSPTTRPSIPVQPQQSRRSDASRRSLGSMPSLTSLHSITELTEEAGEEKDSHAVENGSDEAYASNYSNSSRDDAAPASAVVKQAGLVNPELMVEAPSSDEDEGIAMITARNKNSEAAVRRRNIRTSSNRATSPASVRSIHEANHNKNWLAAFLHTVFVDYIGSFFLRMLCGNRKKALLTVGTAVLCVGIFWKTSKERVQQIVGPWLDQI